jgi:hypothetical protein
VADSAQQLQQELGNRSICPTGFGCMGHDWTEKVPNNKTLNNRTDVGLVNIFKGILMEFSSHQKMLF